MSICFHRNTALLEWSDVWKRERRGPPLAWRQDFVEIHVPTVETCLWAHEQTPRCQLARWQLHSVLSVFSFFHTFLINSYGFPVLLYLLKKTSPVLVLFFPISCAQLLSHVQLFVIPWTVAHQGSLSIGFLRQDYGSGLPFPLPGHLPDPGIKPESPVSSALAGRFFTTGGHHLGRPSTV